MTSVSGSHRCQKSVPDGLRKCSQMGPKSFVKHQFWLPRPPGRPMDDIEFTPIFTCSRAPWGGGSGLKVVHCNERFRGSRFRAILGAHAVHPDTCLLKSTSVGSTCAHEGHQNYFESPSGALMRQQGVPGGSREAQGCLGGSPRGLCGRFVT